MQTWPELHREVARLDIGERRQTAEREIFERWSAIAEDRVLFALAAAAASRARELLEETGANVRVSTSGIARASGPAPRARVVSLELGSSRVDIYSVRATGESPSVNIGVLRGATSTRFPVLASLPGCLVVRRRDGGFDLLLPRLPGEGEAARRTTSIDALVLRAFELLVGTHHSMCPRPAAS